MIRIQAYPRAPLILAGQTYHVFDYKHSGIAPYSGVVFPEVLINGDPYRILDQRHKETLAGTPKVRAEKGLQWVHTLITIPIDREIVPAHSFEAELYDEVTLNGLEYQVFEVMTDDDTLDDIGRRDLVRFPGWGDYYLHLYLPVGTFDGGHEHPSLLLVCSRPVSRKLDTMKEFNGHYSQRVDITDSVHIVGLLVTATLEELGSVETGDQIKFADKYWIYLDQLPVDFGPGQALVVYFIVQPAPETQTNGY